MKPNSAAEEHNADSKPLRAVTCPVNHRQENSRRFNETDHIGQSWFWGKRVEVIRTRGGKIAPSYRFLEADYFVQFTTSAAQLLTSSSNASAWLIKRLAITPSNGSCLKAAPSSIARISPAIVSRFQVQFFIFFVSLR